MLYVFIISLNKIYAKKKNPSSSKIRMKKEEGEGNRLVGFAQSWILMRSFVQCRFPFVSGFLWKQTSGKSKCLQDGGCHELKLQLKLKISVDIRHQSRKSESTIVVKILTTSYLNKLINIHDRANPASPFSQLTLLASC